MKLGTVTILSVICLVMSAVPVMAGPVGVQRISAPALQTQLEAKRQQVSHDMLAPTAKGPLLVRYMNHYSQLTDLIGRVQGGQPISPDEIDQALDRTSR